MPKAFLFESRTCPHFTDGNKRDPSSRGLKNSDSASINRYFIRMENKELTSGEKIGPYRILRKAGEGGMGEVYQGWDDDLDRPVAIKIMSEKAARDPELKDRFRGEGRVLARLRHSHIVALYAQGDHQGLPYMVMEWIEGKTLDEFLVHHPLGLTMLVDIFHQILEGLEAAHSLAIVHRDLKPQNIIVSHDLQIKIIDFGVAKDHRDHLSYETTANIIVGTAHYFAPEVVVGQAATPQSDLYSLGLVFYYALVGQRPFEGKSNLEILEKIRTTDLTLPSRVQILLPVALQTFFLRLTKRNLQQRFQSARKALDELDAVDLNELPADLCISPSSRIYIANSAEVRRLCKDEQLNEFETRLVVNLALDYQATEDYKADVTEKIDLAPVLNINVTSLKEGIRRYRLARSAIISHKTMSQSLYIEPSIQRRSLFIPGLLMSIVLGSLWIGFDKQNHRAVTPLSKAKSTEKVLRSPNEVPVERIPKKDPVDGKTYPLPELKPGTQISIRTSIFRDGDPNPDAKIGINRNWVLKKKEAGSLFWESPEGGQWVATLDLMAPPQYFKTNYENGDREVKTAFIGDPKALFPLYAGKSISYGVVGSEKSKAGEVSLNKFNYKCVVENEEKTRVRAGDFDTIVVSCKGDAPPFLEDKFHYAPKLQHWVLRETSQDVGIERVRRKTRHELMGYVLPR